MSKTPPQRIQTPYKLFNLFYLYHKCSVFILFCLLFYLLFHLYGYRFRYLCRIESFLCGGVALFLPGIVFDTQDCVGVFTLLLFLLPGIVFDTYVSV